MFFFVFFQKKSFVISGEKTWQVTIPTALNTANFRGVNMLDGEWNLLEKSVRFLRKSGALFA